MENYLWYLEFSLFVLYRIDRWRFYTNIVVKSRKGAKDVPLTILWVPQKNKASCQVNDKCALFNIGLLLQPVSKTDFPQYGSSGMRESRFWLPPSSNSLHSETSSHAQLMVGFDQHVKSPIEVFVYNTNVAFLTFMYIQWFQKNKSCLSKI